MLNKSLWTSSPRSQWQTETIACSSTHKFLSILPKGETVLKKRSTVNWAFARRVKTQHAQEREEVCISRKCRKMLPFQAWTHSLTMGRACLREWTHEKERLNLYRNQLNSTLLLRNQLQLNKWWSQNLISFKRRSKILSQSLLSMQMTSLQHKFKQQKRHFQNPSRTYRHF